MRAKKVYEFEKGQDPKRALEFGTESFPSLIEEYEFLVNKYPELDITNSYKVRGFSTDYKWEKGDKRDLKNTIIAGFHRPHPMSGYSGGRTQNLGFWVKIKWMPRKKVYRGVFTELDGGYETWKKEFQTLEDALRFGISKFEGLLSYYPDLKK